MTALTDQSSAPIQTYTYNAFGDVTNSTGSAVNPYQFSSKHFDPNSGLSYFGRRHYSSSLGRFITQYPKEYVDGLNMYAYVKNNPVNFVDLMGKCTKPKPTCEWRQYWTRLNFPLNMQCLCFWNCVPEEGRLWDGNLATADVQNYGFMIYTGGGGLEEGDECICPHPSETESDIEED